MTLNDLVSSSSYLQTLDLFGIASILCKKVIACTELPRVKDILISLVPSILEHNSRL